ncbi:phenylalanine--tRNA ligase subunit beta [Patescibacteria group bacterium]|nr:phenylalanine--tRNA ligase subunit beta [Patescibacteria group bacterium]
MLFSYNWLRDYIKGKTPTPGKLAELLTMHSFEVESVARKGKDFVLDIDILPNRAPDCFSHLGIARESAALEIPNFQLPISKLKEDKKLKAKDFVEVEVKNKEDCPRYTAKVISGVKVASAPKWIQERLKACGLQSINNIVDTTNYVMLETGQPIHAFDLDKVGKKIIVRRAKKNEKIRALDDKTYKLDKDILVIADQKRPIAIAGIKGGERTAIDKKTKNIVIEAANFNQKVVRQGSKKLKLKTDASWRFENGIDPNLIDFVQERVVALIQKIAGGKVARGLVDFYLNKVRPKKINLDLNYVEKLLGLKIPKQKVLKILKSLGFKLSEVGSQKIMVEVPTRRLDISIQEDLIEEIGRIYGFQNIPSVFPQAALISPERNEELFWQKNIKDILKEAGFSEVYNYSFIGEKEKGIFGWRERELVELENPISSFNKYLRPSLIPNLLRNIKENLKYFDEIKLFELGKIFKRFKIQEKKMLAGVLTRKGIKDEGFYELKGVVDSLLNKLGISNIWYDEYQPTPEESKLAIWHPKKSAEIKINGEEIGFLGEVHPKIIENLEIGHHPTATPRVFVFDLDFQKLLKLASEEHEYQPISVYPAAIRDLAILVPQGTKVVEVLNKINAGGGKLVRDVDLFDVYRGEGIPEGKENFAFHIIYQAEDRTLSSREIDKIHRKIIKALEENLGWEVRK